MRVEFYVWTRHQRQRDNSFKDRLLRLSLSKKATAKWIDDPKDIYYEKTVYVCILDTSKDIGNVSSYPWGGPGA